MKALLVAMLLLLGLPAAARAQFLVSFGSGPEPSVIQRVSGTMTGDVTVDYRGADGCAEAGLCGVRGTIVFMPAREVPFFISKSEGRPTHVTAFVGAGGLEEEAGVRAAVRRGDGVCSDLGDSHGGDLGGSAAPDGTVDMGLQSVAPLLVTRCAGPAPEDLRAALGSLRVPVRHLRAGRHTLDLRFERPFAGGGLSGTVRSTVTIRIGAATRRRSGSSGPLPPGLRRQRTRRVAVVYRVTAMNGTVRTDLRPSSDPFPCGLLDACAVGGSITVTPAAGSGRFFVTATAPARRPWRDLRAAVGLTARGRVAGVELFGHGFWHGPGTTAAEITRADAPPCRSTSSMRRGFLILRGIGGRARLESFDDDQPGADPVRTRCPGPRIRDMGGALASAVVRPVDLGARRPVLTLGRGRSFTSDAYAGTVTSDLRLELERARVRRRTISNIVQR